MHRLNIGLEQPQVKEQPLGKLEPELHAAPTKEQDFATKTNPGIILPRQKLSHMRSKRARNVRRTRVKAKNLIWTQQDEKLLFEYQNQYGNCWSIIARKLNRPDNSVKNRYYSTFRKSVRHINKFIKKYCRRQQLKILTNANMLAILAACQESNLKSTSDQSVSSKCKEIKMKMLQHAADPRGFQRQKIVQLIREFFEVNNLIKLLKNQYSDGAGQRANSEPEEQPSQAGRQLPHCHPSNTTSPRSQPEPNVLPMLNQEFFGAMVPQYNTVAFNQPYVFFPYQHLFYNPALVYLQEMHKMAVDQSVRNCM